MIRGLLLDSGDTVVGPRVGRWNPRFDFEAVLLEHWPEAPQERFAAGVAAGELLLATTQRTPSRADYHRAVLDALGMGAPSPELLAELDRPLPPEQLFAVFDDVVPALDALRERGIRMAIVSDNWATLPDLYEALGLGAYFESVVISEVLGCTKPDPRMYRAGSDALGFEPHECLFVDDDPDLVRAAVELGYAGAVIDRRDAVDAPDLLVITSLAQLLDLAAMRPSS